MQIHPICTTDDPLSGRKYINLFAKIEEATIEKSLLVALNTMPEIQIITLCELGKLIIMSSKSPKSLISLTSVENNKFCITTADYDIDVLNEEFNSLILSSLDH